MKPPRCCAGSFGLLGTLGLLGALRQAWDARAAWVGAAALLAGFTPVWLLSSGYVEWLVFLQGLGALLLLAAWRKHGTDSLLIWAGVFTGLAVGGKYPLGCWRWRGWRCSAGRPCAAGCPGCG